MTLIHHRTKGDTPMTALPLEFILRTPDEAIRLIGHITPDADFRHLEALLQKETASAHEILSESLRFCEETSLGADMVSYVCQLLVREADTAILTRQINIQLAQLFIALGEPPRG